MGGNNSIQSNTSMITNAISDNIVSVMQNNRSLVSGDQSVNISCGQALIKVQFDAYIKCLSDKNIADKGFCKEITKSLCSGENINLSMIINVDNTSTQRSEVSSAVSTTIESKIREAIRQKLPILSFNDKINSSIASVVNAVQNNSTDIVQTIYNGVSGISQSVNIDGGGVLKFVSLDFSTKYVSNTIQSNSVVMSSIQSLATEIDKTLDQSGSSILRTIVIIIVSIVSVLIIIALGIYIKKKNKYK